MPFSFAPLDGRRIRVEEYQVELGHRDQLEEVAQHRADDHVLDHDVEPVPQVDRRYRQRRGV